MTVMNLIIFLRKLALEKKHIYAIIKQMNLHIFAIQRIR